MENSKIWKWDKNDDLRDANDNAIVEGATYFGEDAKLAEEHRDLIAAAPFLLDTLETIASFAPGNGDVCEIIARRARAAIAKAYGEE